MVREMRSEASAPGSAARSSPPSASRELDRTKARCRLQSSTSQMAQGGVAGGDMLEAASGSRDESDKLAHTTYGGGQRRHLPESDESDESDADDDQDAYGVRAGGRHTLASTWSHHSLGPSHSRPGQPCSASRVSVSIGKSGVLSRHVASGSAGARRSEVAAQMVSTAGSAPGYYSWAEEEARSGRGGVVSRGSRPGRDGTVDSRSAAGPRHSLRVQNWAAAAGSEGRWDGRTALAMSSGRSVAGEYGDGGGLLTRDMRARAELLAGEAGCSDEERGDSDVGWGESKKGRAPRGLFPPI